MCVGFVFLILLYYKKKKKKFPRPTDQSPDKRLLDNQTCSFFIFIYLFLAILYGLYILFPVLLTVNHTISTDLQAVREIRLTSF